jgi:hypothetical protein
MHLMDIDEDYTTFSLKQIILNITIPYMYEVFMLQDINLMFLQYYQNTIYIIIMDISQHFCDVFVPYYIIVISNFQ